MEILSTLKALTNFNGLFQFVLLVALKSLDSIVSWLVVTLISLGGKMLKRNINLSCPINELSYGIVSRNILKSMVKLGVNVALWPVSDRLEAPPDEHEMIRAARDNAKKYDEYANSIRIWHQFDLAQHVGRGLKIGFPIFELTEFNIGELIHLRAMDRIAVCSQWAADVIDYNLKLKNARVVPLGVDDKIFNEHVKPMELGLSPDTTVFMNVGKWEVRKGHGELILAFNQAFTMQDNVALILHCKNIFSTEQEENEWVEFAKNKPMGERTHIINDRLPTQQSTASLMAAADCGVFPSRAEGWNLPLAEMMRMGKHCIATGYSAHTEFADSTNCSLIEVNELEPADDGKWFHSINPEWDNHPGQWAMIGKPQMEQLIEYMRAIHKAKQEGMLGVNKFGIERMREFTWERSAKALLDIV